MNHLSSPDSFKVKEIERFATVSKRSRRSFLLAATGAAGALAAAPVLSSTRFQVSAQEPQAGGSLTVGLQSEPSDNIDPHRTPWAVSHNIMMHVFDTLVWQDPGDGSFHPGLADSWEAAPDGMSYSFTLKSGVTFHDGTPFDGEAVKFSFDRIVDPETASGFSANLIGPYTATEVVDAQNITVTFSEPYAPFLDSLSQAFLGIVSPTAVEEFGDDFGVTAAAGTGPFMFSEWVRSDHLTLVKNPDYDWAGGLFLHTGPAYLDEIIFRFIPEDLTRSGTLESGETQLIELVPASDVEILESAGYQILAGRAPGIPSVIQINLTKAPTDDPAVRRAIALATDKQAIIDAAYFGVYDPATSPLSGVSWAYNADTAAHSVFDPDAAATELEAAGWLLNGDIREKDGAQLSLELIATQNMIYAELWQSQLREVGINVNIQIVDNGTWIEAGSTGGHNVTPIGWISSDPIILEHLYHSRNIGSGFNWSFIDDPAIDALLDAGKASVDVEERRSSYGQVQMLLLEQNAVLPIYDQIGYNGLAPNLHDVRTDARGWYRWLYDAWFE